MKNKKPNKETIKAIEDARAGIGTTRFEGTVEEFIEEMETWKR